MEIEAFAIVVMCAMILAIMAFGIREIYRGITHPAPSPAQMADLNDRLPVECRMASGKKVKILAAEWFDHRLLFTYREPYSLWSAVKPSQAYEDAFVDPPRPKPVNEP